MWATAILLTIATSQVDCQFSSLFQDRTPLFTQWKNQLGRYNAAAVEQINIINQQQQRIQEQRREKLRAEIEKERLRQERLQNQPQWSLASVAIRPRPVTAISQLFPQMSPQPIPSLTDIFGSRPNARPILADIFPPRPAYQPIPSLADLFRPRPVIALKPPPSFAALFNCTTYQPTPLPNTDVLPVEPILPNPLASPIQDQILPEIPLPVIPVEFEQPSTPIQTEIPTTISPNPPVSPIQDPILPEIPLPVIPVEFEQPSTPIQPEIPALPEAPITSDDLPLENRDSEAAPVTPVEENPANLPDTPVLSDSSVTAENVPLENHDIPELSMPADKEVNIPNLPDDPETPDSAPVETDENTLDRNPESSEPDVPVQTELNNTADPPLDDEASKPSASLPDTEEKEDQPSGLPATQDKLDDPNVRTAEENNPKDDVEEVPVKLAAGNLISDVLDGTETQISNETPKGTVLDDEEKTPSKDDSLSFPAVDEFLGQVSDVLSSENEIQLD